MQDNIVQLSGLPTNTTQAQVRKAFDTFSLGRIEVRGTNAYIEFNDVDDIDSLEIKFDNMEVADLANAAISKHQGVFQWSTSPSFLLEEKKSPKDHSDNSAAVDLSIPDITNLILIKGCDPKLLAFANLKLILSAFSSINRCLKEGSTTAVIEFLNGSQIDEVQSKFPGLKVQELGDSAYIDLPDDTYDVKSFAVHWAKQEEEAANGSEEKTGGLNSAILPKLEKQTSMETNFLLEGEETKEENTIPSTVLEEETITYIDTEKELQEKKKIEQEAAKKKAEEDAKIKKAEENAKIKKAEDEKRIKEEQAAASLRKKVEEEEQAIRAKKEEMERKRAEVIKAQEEAMRKSMDSIREKEAAAARESSKIGDILGSSITGAGSKINDAAYEAQNAMNLIFGGQGDASQGFDVRPSGERGCHGESPKRIIYTTILAVWVLAMLLL